MFVKGHKNFNVGQNKKSLPDNAEMLFLDYYYSEGSETKGNAVKSALKAGYAESMAIVKATRIIRRYGNASAAESLRAVGINKPYLAARLRHVLANAGSKEILAAARLAYSLMGETTDEAKGTVSNTFNAPVMVIVGANQKRIDDLRNATPQPTKEELEQASEARGWAMLEGIKNGTIPHIQKYSKAKLDDQEESVPNLDSADALGDSETQSPQG